MLDGTHDDGHVYQCGMDTRKHTSRADHGSNAVRGAYVYGLVSPNGISDGQQDIACTEALRLHDKESAKAMIS